MVDIRTYQPGDRVQVIEPMEHPYGTTGVIIDRFDPINDRQDWWRVQLDPPYTSWVPFMGREIGPVEEVVDGDA